MIYRRSLFYLPQMSSKQCLQLFLFPYHSSGHD
uniref:Uncharacterized protein n=1 Tax=Rhizophora mucronata TaxID=61149 RepID=A0A2P2J9C5_RHIMU